MTTLSEDDVDGEYLDDPIQLNFGDNEPCLDNLQLIDPGIIVLDSSDGEDSKPTEETSPPCAATSLNPATSENKHGNLHLIPAIIKLVDCFKFPWYFDSKTRQVIERDLSVTEDTTTKTTKVVMNTKEPWRFSKKKRRTDLELENALKQRNKSKIDIKRNTGLIGIKIQKMLTQNAREEKELSKVMANTGSSASHMLYVQSIDKALLNVGTIITPVLKDTEDVDQILPFERENQNIVSNSGTCNINMDNSKLSPKKDTNIHNLNTTNSFHNVSEQNEDIIYNKAVKVAKEITRLYNSKDKTSNSNQLNELKETSFKPMPMCKKIDVQHKRKTENSIELETISKVNEKASTGNDEEQQLTENFAGKEVRDEKNNTQPFIQKSKIDVCVDDNSEVNVKPATSITFTVKALPCNSNMNKFTEKILEKKEGFQNAQTNAKANLFKEVINLATYFQPIPNDVFKIKSNINNKPAVKKVKAKKPVKDKTIAIKPFQGTNYNNNSKQLTKEPKITKINLNNHKTGNLPISSMNNSHLGECSKVQHKSPLKYDASKTKSINYRTKNIEPADIIPPSEDKSNYLVSISNISATKPKTHAQRKQSVKVVPPEMVVNIDDYMKINQNSINQVAPSAQVHLQSAITHTTSNKNRNNINIRVSNIQESPPVPISSNYQEQAKPMTVYNSLQSHILYRPQNRSVQQPTRPTKMFPHSPPCNYRMPMMQSNHHQAQVYRQPRYPTPSLPSPSYIRGYNPPTVTENQIHQQNMLYWRYRLPPPPPPPPPPPLPNQSLGSPRLQYTAPEINDSIIGRNNEGIVTRINIPPSAAHLKTSKEPDKNDNKVEIKSITKLDSPGHDKVPSCVPKSPKLVTTKSEMRRELDISVERMNSPVEYLGNFIGELDPPSLPPVGAANDVSSRVLSGINNDNNYNNINKLNRQQTKSSIQQTENIVSDMQKIINSIYNAAFDQNKNLPSNKSRVYSTSKENKELKSSTTERNIMEINTIRVGNAEPKLSDHTSDPKYIASALQNAKEESSASRTFPIKHKTHDVNREHQNYTSNSMKSLPKEQSEYERKLKSLPIHHDKFQKRSPTCPLSEVPQKHKVNKSVNSKRSITNNDSLKTSPRNKDEPEPLSKKLKINDPRVGYDKTKPPERPKTGYSPPIRRIPTYEEILADSSRNRYCHTEKTNMIGCVYGKSSSKQSTTRKQYLPFESNHKDAARRISLDEYKKRCGNESKIEEERITFTKTRKENGVEKHVDMPRRVSNVDSDLGYDSDSTVKL